MSGRSQVSVEQSKARGPCPSVKYWMRPQVCTRQTCRSHALTGLIEAGDTMNALQQEACEYLQRDGHLTMAH